MSVVITGVCFLGFQLIVNGFRFLLSPRLNTMVLCISAVVSAIYAHILFDVSLTVSLWLFIVVSAAALFRWGGLASALISCAIVLFSLRLSLVTIQVQDVAMMGAYIICGYILGAFAKSLKQEMAVKRHRDKQLYQQSKELHLLREISFGLQSTFEIEHLLHIVLTAITAGYGLGLNRAMLLHRLTEEPVLEGAFAIGPMSAEEGFEIWERLVTVRWSLRQLIERRAFIKRENSLLNDKVSELRVPLTAQGGVIARAAMERKAIHVTSLDLEDPVQRTLHDTFGMTEFAAVPLINQGRTLGVILVDNIVDHRPITIDDIDGVTTLAQHAAMAVDNARLYHRMESMAITDGLTGLYNHRFFNTMLSEYFAAAQSNTHPLSVMLLDIDDFKHYNDHFGHLAGNEVLKDVSALVRSLIRDTDLLCRFGGEEFVLLCPMTDSMQVWELANQIQSAIASAPFLHSSEQPLGRISVSVGVSTYPGAGFTAQELVDAADSAMYQAKQTGKNRVMAYQEVVQS